MDKMAALTNAFMKLPPRRILSCASQRFRKLSAELNRYRATGPRASCTETPPLKASPAHYRSPVEHPSHGVSRARGTPPEAARREHPNRRTPYLDPQARSGPRYGTPSDDSV